MNTVTVDVGVLRGMLLAIPKKDARFYLVGLHIDFDRRNLVATDGARMIVYRADDIRGTGAVTVPRDVIVSAGKAAGKRAKVEISWDGGTVINAAAGGVSIAGTAIDGRYPEYLRVIPREPSGEFGFVCPQLAAEMVDAFRAAGMGADAYLRVKYNGASGAAVYASNQVPNMLGIIMPLRPERFCDDLAVASALALFCGSAP